MVTYQKIALLGKGTLGSAVLSELAAAGFEVTVLGRSESSKQGLPDGVAFITVDYSSIDGLAAALKGQDAVVSTLGGAGVFAQKQVIDASIKAGVKRFVPSDWASFTDDPKSWEELPFVLGPFIDTRKYLAEKASSGEIEHTIFSVGGFTDFAVQFPLLFDYPNKRVELWDDGRHPFSSTSLSGIGKAVVGAFRNPDATRNRNIRVHELVVTQAQLVALAKKYSPPGTEWTQTAVDGQAEFEKARALAQEDPTDEGKALGAIKAALLSGRYESAYEQVDNELLGVPLLTEKDLEARFAAAYKS
ncbi:hypothetical protein CCHL11_00390 [Colletotrichum chlorophyti]|uniref:NAD(P)-binding domain-containing protein n=1 Tax=Colletotrichum chlorophyti TaxID=708187 RepID=A0A1Q8RTX8_9PEZI|nr:hypothetical protein CCHL11_00390 [Colletotrichum chlorophyti]